MDISKLEREQDRDVASLQAAVTKVEGLISALDPDIRDEARRNRISDLRNGAKEELRPILGALRERAARAEALEREYSPATVMRRARFHEDDALNASISLATSTRLARTSTPELIEHLVDAVAAHNLPLVEAVRLEFTGRDDNGELKHEFGEHLSRLKFPELTEAKQSIGRIAARSGIAEERYTAVMTGRADPVARLIAAHRATAA